MRSLRLDPTRVPRHIAITPDGSGRWAQAHGLDRSEGHAAGDRALLRTVRAALRIGIPWLTVFLFSTENWKRPDSEIDHLFDTFRLGLLAHQSQMNDLGVRVRFAGHRDPRMPMGLLHTASVLEETTFPNRALTLTLCLNHGGHAEIAEVARAISVSSARGARDPGQVSEHSVSSRLPLADAPDLDLVIRTSGEHRLSNFLLWESAYCYLAFPKVLWPDFSGRQLYAGIRWLQRQPDRRR